MGLENTLSKHYVCEISVSYRKIQVWAKISCLSFPRECSTQFYVCYSTYLQNLQQENAELQAGISLAQTQLETALAAHETQRRVIDTLNAQLASRIQDLVGIHKEMAMALQTWGFRQPEWLWEW